MEKRHHVQLDGREQPLKLLPHEVEAWPRIGQCVRLIDPPGGGEQWHRGVLLHAL